MKKSSWSTCILIFLAVITVTPIIIASDYSFYHADDFIHANVVGVYDEGIGKLLGASLRFAKSMYLTWQGTYTAMFLQAFLSPLNGFGHAQLRIVMILNIILFIVSLGYFMESVCRRLNINNFWTIFSLCIIGIFGFVGWHEVFYWFSGAVSYSFPMSFCLLGIAIILRCPNSVKGCVAAAVLMLLASGWTLEVAGIGCFILLGICIIRKISGNVGVKEFIVFGTALIGALINTVAPGNYVRHAVIDDTGLHFGTAVLSTALETIHSLEDLVFDIPVVLIMIIATITGAYFGRDIRSKNTKILLQSVLLCVGTPFVACFPVCLAYSGGGYFPNRCKFIETVVWVVALILIASIVGYIKSEQIIKLIKKDVYIALAMFMVIMANINSSWRFSQSVFWKMWEEIAQGSYREHYNEVHELYNLIASDTNENVFVYEKPQSIDDFAEVYLSEDMSDNYNRAIAQYYHKESVQYVSEPLYTRRDGGKNIRISSNLFDGQTGYVSIFKIYGAEQSVEALQILSPIESNVVINVSKEENGRIAIYLFADSEGKVQIDEMEIGY